jgi:cell division initiation protein
MKLTPLDIRKQEFRKTLRGFDPIEVQTFLEMVGEEYEQVLQENKQLNNRLIELETKLKDFQETEKNLRETLLNVQEVKKQSEESSRRQADLLIKEAELKALEIIELARKQARKMRDEVNILKTQKESFINRLRQILISQIELLSVLEIDEAVPEEAFKFLENVRSRKQLMFSETDLNEKSLTKSEKDDRISDIELAEDLDIVNEGEKKSESQAAGKQKSSGKVTEEVSESEKKAKSEKTKEVSEKESRQKKIDDEINEFFKKEIQIDDFIKNNDNKKQK